MADTMLVVVVVVVVVVIWRNKRREDTGFKCLWLSSNGERLNAHGQKPRTPHRQFSDRQSDSQLHYITDRCSGKVVNPHSHVEQTAAHSALREVVDAPRL
jgi:hypothetical protein